MPLPKPPNYNESDLHDKPRFVARFNRSISSRREAAIAERMHQRWEALLAVDDGVEEIIGALRRTGELDNTYVIFTSDNGYMQGEHRSPGGEDVALRRLDSSAADHSRPRAPARADARGHWSATWTSRRRSSMRPQRVLHARSTGARSCRSRVTSGCAACGRSFTRQPARAPKGRVNTREGGARGTQPRVPAWSAVRTTRWLYIEYRGGQRELYDLKRDPWEMRSVVLDDPRSGSDPKHASAHPRRPRAVPRARAATRSPRPPCASGEGGIRTLDGGFPPYSLSRRVPSATRPPLREGPMLKQPALQAQ